MYKTDKSIKEITIASIKRSTIPPFDFEYTKIYDVEEETKLDINESIELINEEKLICSSIITKSLWSILTTRRIITLEGVNRNEHLLQGLIKRDAGDFKGYSNQKFTKGFLLFSDNSVIPYFIETGRASMVMIYGINTVTKLLNGEI